MHKALFAYLLPIFKRNVENVDSDEIKSDISSLSDEEIYEKFFINSEVETPYKLNIETDFQEYLKRPCSWCKAEKCKDCELTRSDEILMKDVMRGSVSTYHTFKLQCIINPKSALGQQISKLNSLDHMRNSTTPDATSNEATVSIQDCFEMFQRTEKLEGDNEWYCSVCKEHKQALK